MMGTGAEALGRVSQGTVNIWLVGWLLRSSTGESTVVSQVHGKPKSGEQGQLRAQLSAMLTTPVSDISADPPDSPRLSLADRKSVV